MRVLIFGCTGQDGSYIAEHCIKKGYEVFGTIRKTSASRLDNLSDILRNPKFSIIKADITDAGSVYQAIIEAKPDLIFNEADQDHVAWSKLVPALSLNTTVLGALNILEAVKTISPDIQIFQPLSSNIFGEYISEKYDESTIRLPVSIYGIAKNTIGQICENYRRTFGLNITTGILFNHESPRRTHKYFTRKVSQSASRIKKGFQTELLLGDLDIQLDLGYAPEFAKVIVDLTEKRVNQDIVVGTENLTSLRSFVSYCFSFNGLDYQDFVQIDQKFIRKNPTKPLCASTELMKCKLGYKLKVGAKEIAEIMTQYDTDNIEKIKGHEHWDI